MRASIIFILVSTLLTGCALIDSFPESAKGASSIKIIDESASIKCKYISVATGVVYGLTQSESENMADAELQAAEQALELGANAAKIVRKEVQNPGNIATVTMEAYKCPE